MAMPLTSLLSAQRILLAGHPAVVGSGLCEQRAWDYTDSLPIAAHVQIATLSAVVLSVYIAMPIAAHVHIATSPIVRLYLCALCAVSCVSVRRGGIHIRYAAVAAVAAGAVVAFSAQRVDGIFVSRGRLK